MKKKFKRIAFPDAVKLVLEFLKDNDDKKYNMKTIASYTDLHRDTVRKALLVCLYLEDNFFKTHNFELLALKNHLVMVGAKKKNGK